MHRSTLTILFQDPFWIGLYEREEDGRYQVCRIVFGAEPRDQEVYQFLLEHWRKLRFSPAVAGGLPPEAIRNPKRRQREVQRETRTAGIGTKAQQALKLQQEQGKLERKVRSRQEKEAEEARRFQLRDSIPITLDRPRLTTTAMYHIRARIASLALPEKEI